MLPEPAATITRQPSNPPSYRLQSELWLPVKREDVFAFFSDARNLNALTPPWLHFRILTPEPIEMRAGTLIDYALRLRGIPIRWQSEITVWEPPGRFVDSQRRGPYRTWHHEHTFVESDHGTMVHDTVDYAVLGGRWIHRLFVQRDLESIFEYRHQKLRERFDTNTET